MNEPGQPETTPQPNPDLAGYPDQAALVQGYRASSQEAQRQKARADQLEAQLQAAANQRPEIPQRPVNPYDRLADYGVPPDAVREVIQSEVQQGIAQAFQPIARGFEARNRMLAGYPDYAKYEADVASFINSDQDVNQTYQRMFNADPVAAMEYAFLKFGDSRRRTAGGGNSSNGVNQEQAAQASIPGSRAGESRNAGTGNQTVLQQTWEHYEKTGDPKPFARARLRGVISDDWLNG